MKAAYQKTLDVLEWFEWAKLLLEQIQSPMGMAYVEKLSPDQFSREEAFLQSQSILDLVDYHQKQRFLPLSDLHDLSSLYSRMERQGAISVAEFAQLIRNQRAVLSLRSVLLSSACPHLQKTMAALDPLSDWCDVHFPLIDQHGEIADCASEDLRALRILTRDLKKKIENKLKSFLNDPHLGEVLRDDYVTLRDGRCVIPIKNNFKSRVPGIIHDLSKSESTLFIEPEAIVELNNQLKMAEREIQYEIERILAVVVERSKEVIADFRSNQALLALADYLQAAAKLVGKWDNFCLPEESSELCFEALAHPLLSLQGPVVSNNLEWKEALVLSGPNTGGKTVLLKSVGLALCFARVGIPLCAKSAKIPSDLKEVYAEMGDDQNLFEKLSTFSAHMASLSRIYRESQQGDLVLIDELATGTSPEDGQALARALIEAFLEKEVRVFVTTHYAALKHMALADERCRVASMSYDVKKRLPLYKIIMDVPGESSAFDVAERLGFPQEVVQRAKDILGEGSKDLSKAIESLENSRKRFEDRLQDIQQLERELKNKESELERLKGAAQERLQKLSREEARELLQDYRLLKEALSTKIEALSDLPKTTEIFEEISHKSQTLKKMAQEDVFVPQKRGLSPEEIKKGLIVDISGLGLGMIEDIPSQKEKLSAKTLINVKVGELKTRVSFERIFEASAAEKQRFSQGRKSWLNLENKKSKMEDSSTKGGSFVCDVRGKSWEDASRRIDSALNMLTSGEKQSITIVHGHGKEILKERIRSYIEKERPEFKYRTGSWPGEGGDGVSIVEAV